jgi:predicted phosphoribosyltransferase
VPVAYEVAVALEAPLDVFVVRKLGVPGHAELAMGAIADGGVRVLNQSVVELLGLGDAVIADVAAREATELARRQVAYRGARSPVDVAAKIVIVVDDGLATGATMRAAVVALRSQGPARIVVAVPVGARSTCEQLRAEADEVVCVRAPFTFQAVGQWYEDFSPTTDEEIRSLLDRTSGPARPD